MNMSVRAADSVTPRRGTKPPLLDVAAEVLVGDPAASLAEVAEAAGIGRTTLHKHYATRDDLIRAVGHRAIDLWEQAVDAAASSVDGLRAMITAMIPAGPQLAFIWRTPALDHDKDFLGRWDAVEERCLAVLKQAQSRGILAADVPDWWLMRTFYSLIYVAAESVGSGHLAPRDAPDFMLGTFLRGIGSSPAV
jgi:AcrR family transcriptional regulator